MDVAGLTEINNVDGMTYPKDLNIWWDCGPTYDNIKC